MLDERTAFKFGFLACCADAGLSPREAYELVKSATEKQSFEIPIVSDVVRGGVDVTKSLAGALSTYGLPALLAAPPVAGGAIGYGLAKMTDMDDVDVGEVKKRELIEEYRRQQHRLLRSRAARDYRQQRLQEGQASR